MLATNFNKKKEIMTKNQVKMDQLCKDGWILRRKRDKAKLAKTKERLTKELKALESKYLDLRTNDTFCGININYY